MTELERKTQILLLKDKHLCDVTGVFNEFCHQNYQFCLHETNKWSDHYLSGKPAN